MNQEPEVLRQIDWVEYGQTVLHPLALLLLLLMAFVLLSSRSRFVLIPFLVVGALLTHMQRLVIGSADFSMIRLLLIAGLMRSVLRNDACRFEWDRMDSLMVAYVLVLSLAYVALRQSSGAVMNRLGFAFEVLLAFFLIRVYVHEWEQLFVFVRGLAAVMALVATFMLVEQLTRYNPFSMLGGVPEMTPIRNGRLRAQGAFSHPIMAGTFAAAFAPLYWALWQTGQTKDRGYAALGGVSALVMTWASSSSGPVLTLLAGAFAVWSWNVRSHLRTIRLAAVGALIGLHIVMEAPVWHLISRVDLVGGSTGWHRYALIDQTINRFPEWALLGVRTTGHWGWGLNDVTNMYVAQAVNGGIAGLILFILVIGAAFRSVRDALASASGDARLQKFIWAWDAVLFAHCVSFIGVTYFGQMNYFWTLSLAIPASLPGITGRLSAGLTASTLGLSSTASQSQGSLRPRYESST